MLDVAIERMPKIKAMLQQGLREGADISASKDALAGLFPGFDKGK